MSTSYKIFQCARWILVMRILLRAILRAYDFTINIIILGLPSVFEARSCAGEFIGHGTHLKAILGIYLDRRSVGLSFAWVSFFPIQCSYLG